VTQIIHGRRASLAAALFVWGTGSVTSAQFWLNLQNAYDIRVAEQRQGRK
jgi:antitoxin HigA-1